MEGRELHMLEGHDRWHRCPSGCDCMRRSARWLGHLSQVHGHLHVEHANHHGTYGLDREGPAIRAAADDPRQPASGPGPQVCRLCQVGKGMTITGLKRND